MSALLKSRVRYAPYLKKVLTPEETIPFFKNGQDMGWSGFAVTGCPKVVPAALAKHVEQNNLQGKLGFNLFSGASTGPDEIKWAELNMLNRRSPYQAGKSIASGINGGSIQFFDKHLSMWPQDLRYGYYTKQPDGTSKSLDLTIVEATAIDENGGIILGPAVGGSPELIDYSKNLIIEVNTAEPSYEGLHDINMPELPPFRKPYDITHVRERIGTPAVPVDPSKVLAIVESTSLNGTAPGAPSDDISKSIASHLIDFLKDEVRFGRLPEDLLPLQSGVGNIANAVVEGLAHADFKNLQVWTEVLQDSFLDFLDSGKLDFATTTSITLSQGGFKKFYEKWDEYSKKVLLRAQSISNHPELIRRLGVIAMNTPVEVDIYAHANSTCVGGSRMINGLGGSGDFLRNAKLSILHTPSVRATKTDPLGLSCIVPFVSHIDHTEHDIDIIVTEQGLADLRGMSPNERSKEIIDKIVHPAYKPILEEYVDRAKFYCRKNKSLHEPHALKDAFKLHNNLDEKGTMRLESWD